MKKAFLVSIFLFLISQSPTFAAPAIDDKINELKDKVASRVAELKLVEKRGIIGTVQSTSATTITITDLNDKTRFIDVDEFTEFESLENEESFGISDLKKGSVISTLGLYNKESERLLARFVNEIALPKNIHGVITKKDDEEFTLTLATEEGVSYTVDIERVTRSFSFSKDGLETSGFTKFEMGENAVVTGFLDKEEKDRVTASRIITFPGVSKNPKVPVIEEPPSEADE